MSMKILKAVMPINNFPTKWQTVIFRNYGMFSDSRIAKVLSCDEDTVRREACRLGISNTPYLPEWEKKGYLTAYRNNWFLLPKDQLIELLGISEDKYEFTLKEEDFLGIKLGEFKPECERVSYTPLTDSEIEKTEKIRTKIEKYDVPPTSLPFDFSFDKQNDFSQGKVSDKNTFAHGYLTPCGDVFEVDSEYYLPDSLLKKYSESGVKGLWLHGVLSKLSYYPFDPSLSDGYELRRKRFKSLIDRANKFGLKTYMYMNEPRAVTKEIADKFPDIIGTAYSDSYCLCLETPEVREYFYTALRDLLSECNVGGILTTTMSEYRTHCYSHTKCNCPRCKDKVTMPDSAVRVNNIIQKAIDDSGSDTELIASMWAWTENRGWSEADVFHALDTLDKKISVHAVSETMMPIKKGGMDSVVRDYSVSNPGPGDYAKKYLGYSSQIGRGAYAKIQVNNSWECAAVPYLPAFDLVWKHLENLSDIGIENYMISWTHGGYPSPTFNMISAYGAGATLDEWYESYYGEYAKEVHRAVSKICSGFTEYPFSVEHMYFSPQNLGPANMWSLHLEEKSSGMIGQAWDDYEKWIQPYTYEVFISQTEKMLKLWNEGVEILRAIGGSEKVRELLLMAEASYIHLESDLYHTKYAYLKRDLKKNREELISLMEYEKVRTDRLLTLVNSDGRIGFEASNHYYYTANLLKEKLINMDYLISELSK